MRTSFRIAARKMWFSVEILVKTEWDAPIHTHTSAHRTDLCVYTNDCSICPTEGHRHGTTMWFSHHSLHCQWVLPKNCVVTHVIRQFHNAFAILPETREWEHDDMMKFKREYLALLNSHNVWLVNAHKWPSACATREISSTSFTCASCVCTSVSRNFISEWKHVFISWLFSCVRFSIHKQYQK